MEAENKEAKIQDNIIDEDDKSQKKEDIIKDDPTKFGDWQVKGRCIDF